MLAKLNPDDTITIPTQEDYLEDNLKNPEQWLELLVSEKPQETAVHKYRERFCLISDKFQGERKIQQSWEHYIVEVVGRVAKLSGTSIVYPPQNLTLEDGTLICNANRLPNSRLLDLGFFVVEDTPCPQDGKQYRETGVMVDDADFGSKIKIVWDEIIPEPEPPFPISKTLLKKAMVEAGKWQAFKAVLQSDPDMYEDFDFAVVLMSDDEKVVKMKQVCTQMFGFTEIQIDDMLRRCKSDIT